MFDTEDVGVFLGLDVGKTAHHGHGLTPAGKKVFDKQLPNSEPKLRAVFDKLTAKFGTVLVIVDQPASIGALPLTVARDAGCQVAYLGFDFLGFRIQWRRKRGTDKWHVYTFIADRPIRQLKDKIRALTNRTSQQNPRDVLIRLNQIMRGWANYFKHAVCKATLSSLASFTWHRVISWWMALHRWKWKDVRRRLTDHTGRWQRPSADGIELFDLQAVAVTRYRYRGNTIPNPWTRPNHA